MIGNLESFSIRRLQKRLSVLSMVKALSGDDKAETDVNKDSVKKNEKKNIDSSQEIALNLLQQAQNFSPTANSTSIIPLSTGQTPAIPYNDQSANEQDAENLRLQNINRQSETFTQGSSEYVTTIVRRTLEIAQAEARAAALANSALNSSMEPKQTQLPAVILNLNDLFYKKQVNEFKNTKIINNSIVQDNIVPIFSVSIESFIHTNYVNNKIIMLNNNGNLVLDFHYLNENINNNQQNSSPSRVIEQHELKLFNFLGKGKTSDFFYAVEVVTNPWSKIVFASTNYENFKSGTNFEYRDSKFQSWFYRPQHSASTVEFVASDTYNLTEFWYKLKILKVQTKPTYIHDTLLISDSNFDNQNFQIYPWKIDHTASNTDLYSRMSELSDKAVIVALNQDVELAVAFSKLVSSRILPNYLSNNNQTNFWSHCNFLNTRETRQIAILTLEPALVTGFMSTVNAEWYRSSNNLSRLGNYVLTVCGNKNDIDKADNALKWIDLISNNISDFNNNIVLPKSKIPLGMGLFKSPNLDVTYGRENNYDLYKLTLASKFLTSTMDNLFYELTHSSYSDTISIEDSFGANYTTLVQTSMDNIFQALESKIGLATLISKIEGSTLDSNYSSELLILGLKYYFDSKLNSQNFINKDPKLLFIWSLLGYTFQTHFFGKSPALQLMGSKPFVLADGKTNNINAVDFGTKTAIELILTNWNFGSSISNAEKISTILPAQSTYPMQLNLVKLNSFRSAFNGCFMNLKLVDVDLPESIKLKENLKNPTAIFTKLNRIVNDINIPLIQEFPTELENIINTDKSREEEQKNYDLNDLQSLSQATQQFVDSTKIKNIFYEQQDPLKSKMEVVIKQWTQLLKYIPNIKIIRIRWAELNWSNHVLFGTENTTAISMAKTIFEKELFITTKSYLVDNKNKNKKLKDNFTAWNICTQDEFNKLLIDYSTSVERIDDQIQYINNWNDEDSITSSGGSIEFGDNTIVEQEQNTMMTEHIPSKYESNTINDVIELCNTESTVFDDVVLPDNNNPNFKDITWLKINNEKIYNTKKFVFTKHKRKAEKQIAHAYKMYWDCGKFVRKDDFVDFLSTKHSCGIDIIKNDIEDKLKIQRGTLNYEVVKDRYYKAYKTILSDYESRKTLSEFINLITLFKLPIMVILTRRKFVIDEIIFSNDIYPQRIINVDAVDKHVYNIEPTSQLEYRIFLLELMRTCGPVLQYTTKFDFSKIIYILNEVHNFRYKIFINELKFKQSFIKLQILVNERKTLPKYGILFDIYNVESSGD